MPLDAIKQALTPASVVAWTGAIEYRRQVHAAISAQRVEIEHLVKSLRSAGVLTPGEADAWQPKIVIDPDDPRKNGRALLDLPPVPARGN